MNRLLPCPRRIARPLPLLLPFALATFALAPACGDGGGGGGSPDMTRSDLAPLCSAHTVRCTDEQILDLSLFKKASTRAVENTPDGKDFVTRVDATAGGSSPTESYVYARFTDQGLVRVDIGDEAALSSSEWDIAFRRFVVRLNSGIGGPSCVVGAEVPGKYGDITAVPARASFSEEAYIDDSCKVVPDGSGLGSPGTVLSTFWSYNGCVQMSGTVYIIRRADGRHVKLTVSSYYTPTDAQKTCDSTGSLPAGAKGGDLRLRWSFLD